MLPTSLHKFRGCLLQQLLRGYAYGNTETYTVYCVTRPEVVSPREERLWGFGKAEEGRMIVFRVAQLFSYCLSHRERNEDVEILLQRLVESVLGLENLSNAVVAMGGMGVVG